jgi:hypothetical protein
MILATLTSIFISLSGSPDASNLDRVRCNANSNTARNCYDEFTNAAKNMFGQDNEAERAQTAGEAVKN